MVSSFYIWVPIVDDVSDFNVTRLKFNKKIWAFVNHHFNIRMKINILYLIVRSKTWHAIRGGLGFYGRSIPSLISLDFLVWEYDIIALVIPLIWNKYKGMSGIKWGIIN